MPLDNHTDPSWGKPSRQLNTPADRGNWPSPWDYIKKHELQNPENRREILADDNLEAVFGKKKVTMFEMNKYLTQHLTSPEAGWWTLAPG
jgi:hypothetical protein